MIFFHDFKTGEQFSIKVEDIRYTEVHGGRLVLYHMIPVQIPAEPLVGPDGKMKLGPGGKPLARPPHLEIFLKESMVIETEKEFKSNLQLDKVFGAALNCNAAERAKALRDKLADPEFGGKPRSVQRFDPLEVHQSNEEALGT